MTSKTLRQSSCDGTFSLMLMYKNTLQTALQTWQSIYADEVPEATEAVVEDGLGHSVGLTDNNDFLRAVSLRVFHFLEWWQGESSIGNLFHARVLIIFSSKQSIWVQASLP